MNQIAVCACAIGFGAVSASAAYVGSVVGLGPGDVPTDTLSLAPGESFNAQVVLTGDVGDKNDSAVFRLVFSQPGLEFASGWLQWGAPYTTGGLDDFSSPSATTSGTIDVATHTDVVHPFDVDASFENLTDNFGDYFTTGALVSFSLAVPVGFAPGPVTIQFVPESFTAGASIVEVDAGAALTINVIPSPAVGTIGIALVYAFPRPRRQVLAPTLR